MNRFIIASPEQCIGCRTCEIACVMAHRDSQDMSAFNIKEFLPRLHVVKNVNVSTPVMCRQCEDAPCAGVCPNGAINRVDNMIQVIQERCIGCKTCVVACPYGAMDVVSRPVVREYGASITFGSGKSEAQKCDLCVGRENGPACMESCPTNALHVVDRNLLQKLNAGKRQRAALDNLSSLF